MSRSLQDQLEELERSDPKVREAARKYADAAQTIIRRLPQRCMVTSTTVVEVDGIARCIERRCSKPKHDDHDHVFDFELPPPLSPRR